MSKIIYATLICFGCVLYTIFLSNCSRLNDVSSFKPNTNSDSSTIATVDSSPYKSTIHYNINDTIPLRFLSYEKRLNEYPNKRSIFGLDMVYQLNGSYSHISPELSVKEYYPGAVEFFSFNGLEKIMYYDSSTEEVIKEFRPMNSLPFDLGNKKIIKYGHFDGELYSFDPSVPFYTDFKENSDKLLIDIDLFRWLNSPYKILAYYVWGINELNQLTGFECIVNILDENGNIKYNKRFDKFLVNGFVSTCNQFVCLNFTSPTYTNNNSITGALIIDEISTKKNLLNRFLNEDEGQFGGQLSFQEVLPGYLFLDFDIRFDKRNNINYKKTGLIDLEAQQLFYKYWAKEDIIYSSGTSKNIREDIKLSEWILESSF